jgi:hypothetical protein
LNSTFRATWARDVQYLTCEKTFYVPSRSFVTRDARGVPMFKEVEINIILEGLTLYCADTFNYDKRGKGPNCELVNLAPWVVVLRAIRDIRKDEELCVLKGLDFWFLVIVKILAGAGFGVLVYELISRLVDRIIWLQQKSLLHSIVLPFGYHRFKELERERFFKWFDFTLLFHWNGSYRFFISSLPDGEINFHTEEAKQLCEQPLLSQDLLIMIQDKLTTLADIYNMNRCVEEFRQNADNWGTRERLNYLKERCNGAKLWQISSAPIVYGEPVMRPVSNLSNLIRKTGMF